MKIFNRTITWWRVFGVFHMAAFVIVVAPIALLVFLVRQIARGCDSIEGLTDSLVDFIVILFRCELVTAKVRKSVLDERKKSGEVIDE